MGWQSGKSLGFYVDRKMPLPPSTVSPEPEYGTFHGERGFAVVIKVRDLEMGDYPGLSERAKCKHKGP